MWRYEIKTECHACNAIGRCASTLTQKRELGLTTSFTIDLKCEKCGHPRRSGIEILKKLD